MIIGRFDPAKRPFVRGRLMIPRFDVDAYVNFLIDTGSDVSTLHSRDAVKLGIPFERLESRRTIGGVGGRAEYLVEDEAVLLFHDGPLYRIYVVALAVGKLGPQEANLPSLLGRPLLNNWRTYIDPVDGRVEIVAENAVVNIGADAIDLPPLGQT